MRQDDLEQRLAMPVAELGLPIRIQNFLENAGMDTVGELLERKPADLLGIPMFGAKALEAVYTALEGVGFYRKSRSVTE